MKQNKKNWPIRIGLQIMIVAITAVITYHITSGILLGKAPDQDVSEVSAKDSDTNTEEGHITNAFVDIPVVFPEDRRLQKRLAELVEKDIRFLKVAQKASLYDEEMLEALVEEPAMIDFVMAYPGASNKVTGGLSDLDLEEEFPLFLQWDIRWGFAPFGQDMIAFSGCAPTALSMVAYYLVGDRDVTPDVVADYVMKKGLYIKDSGTDWALFSKHGNAFGIKGRYTPMNVDNIKKTLESGSPIILSMAPGDFTKRGHMIVLAGVTDEGFIVRDPASVKRSQRIWTFEELAPQVKGIWAFTKA